MTKTPNTATEARTRAENKEARRVSRRSSITKRRHNATVAARSTE